jgi:DNA (cytosine-5)-methyltransferase 1
MGAVLGSLVELGYGVAYRVLDAQHFGVPQRRRRVVIVGHLGDDGGASAQVLLEPESSAGDPAAGSAAGARTPRVTDAGIDVAVHPVAPTLAGGGRRGYRVDAETAAGGGLIPVDDVQMYAQQGTNVGDGTGRETPVIAFGHTNGLNAQASEHVTPTLRAGHGVGGGSISSAAAVRRLTPVECERLQGYPDGWTATSNGRPQADSARYRQLGNSIAVPVFAWVMDRIARYEAKAL